MSRTTRVVVGLACGCTRRMPRGTASRSLSEKTTVKCPEHGDTTVTEMEGPSDLAALLRF